MIKKFIAVALLALLSFTVSATEGEWTISTSQGEKTLVIPEGLSLEQAYQQMAVLYWEERYDRETLTATVAELTAEVEAYQSSVEELTSSQEELIGLYRDLQSYYEADSESKSPWVKGMFSSAVGYDWKNKSIAVDLWGGVILKDLFIVEAGLGYPWSAKVKLGDLF